jgi:hypothetical protein
MSLFFRRRLTSLESVTTGSNRVQNKAHSDNIYLRMHISCYFPYTLLEQPIISTHVTFGSSQKHIALVDSIFI